VEPHDSARELLERELPAIATSPRAQVLLGALRQVRAERPEAPVVGNLVGPVSLAASLVKPDLLLREAFRQPDLVREALERLTGLLVEFGKKQIAAGAEVVAIADPTATGEILGPRAFAELAAPALARLTRELQQAGARVIVHICGNVHTIALLLASIGADAISVDDMVNLRKLREQAPEAAIMGNVCALHLEEGPVERIERWVRGLGLRQADIIAPACAIVPATPLRHLQALVRAAADGAKGGARFSPPQVGDS
jgi:[methyl-Co(III) methanol-specific corrinoid protein]:coenzyme M methyltransferase